MEKRGISPVIATVLLIALVVVLALLIFLWARSFVGESLEKEDGQSAVQACRNINLDVAYSGGSIQISNNGNVPVYKFNVIKKGSGSEVRDEFDTSIRIGSTVSKSIGSGYQEVEVVPVVLGETDRGERKSKTCDNSFKS